RSCLRRNTPMKTSLVSTIAALVLCGSCLAPSIRAGGGDQPKETLLDLTIKDKLTGDDPKDKFTKQASKVKEMQLTSGHHYISTMDEIGKKGNLDPFLRIEDAAGKELAKDDDSGGDLNARILFTPGKDGVYRIITTTLRGTGGYMLRIREQGVIT